MRVREKSASGAWEGGELEAKLQIGKLAAGPPITIPSADCRQAYGAVCGLNGATSVSRLWSVPETRGWMASLAVVRACPGLLLPFGVPAKNVEPADSCLVPFRFTAC
jgi:hypothetical protein